MTSDEQHRLAAELAVWLAEQIRRCAAFTPTATGPVLDTATSPFAAAAFTLWALGAATTTDSNGNPPEDRGYGTPAPHLRLSDEAGLRRAVADHKITPKDFSCLIRDFVGMKEYVPEAFELSAEWFRPSLPPQLVEAFFAAGFLERSRDRVRWSDLMVQWVEWASPRHLWESKSQSEVRRLKTYGPVWTTMPRWLRDKVIHSGEIDTLMLPDAIRRFWDGEWKPGQLPDWQDQKRLVDAMEIARQIQRLVEEGCLNIDRPNPFSEFFRRFRRRTKG